MIRKKVSFRKVISFICLLSIFIESVPVNALSYGISDIISQEKTQSNSNNDAVDEKSGSDKTANLNDNNEKSDSEDNAKEVISNLEDNMFNAYIDGENELAFSIGFDKKESKFVVKNQSEKQLAKEKLDTIIYKISVYDKESKEKLNIELLGSDTGNTEKLNILNETKYEIGDTIKITPLDQKNGLKILGDIQGDIDKNKEDYSDGVDNLDYIDNVRFEITENNLKTVYNEAPVFEGLTDLLNVENPNVDVLQGVKVTDDHDGQIDNSKIVVAVQEKTETSVILTYTVQDSWGRNTSGTRNISAVNNSDTDEAQNNATTYTGNQSSQTLSNNVITVEGIPYAGGIKERFKIKFDSASKSIKITDEDGRVFSNTEKGEYFKFVLYDKYMEVKTSVTLLGSDKSDSEKLEAINNHLFEEGDYIGIWHAESDTKLKISGTVKQTTLSDGEARPNDQTEDYSNGLPKKEIYERRFRIKNTGLEEVNNDAPVIGNLDPIEISRGGELDLLKDVNGKINDDFDKFDDISLEKGDVSITHTPFDNTKVGEHTVTYTATDKWGNSSTKDRAITVNSDNPLDYTYIEFMKNNGSENPESLFKIKIDPVKKQLYVDNLDNIEDTPIDPSKKSSIFKLKVYTQGGVLQKTLNIKGTDKLKTVLRRINGYSYSNNDRIELWSTTPKNIKVGGTLVEDDKENNRNNKQYEPNENNTNVVDSGNYKEDYGNGIDNDDYMKNVRFELQSDSLKYIYNEAPKLNISTELTTERNGKVDYMNGITVSDDHDQDKDIIKNITYNEIDTTTIGEKYVEYKVTDSWGRSTLTKRKVTVYPYNNLEYNYITIKNNQTNEAILSIKFDDKAKKFKVYKLDASKIPSDLEDNSTVLELKLIKKNSSPILKLFKSNESEKNITITKEDLKSNNLEEKFTDVEYKYGDYLSFKTYDYENGIFISAKSHILLNGFDSGDQMTNSRFEIKQEGLQMIYNNAPQIHGLENTLYLYRGDNLTLEKALEGISAKDDLDGDISNIIVKHNGSLLPRTVDTNVLGNITLTYEVADSWGRTTSGERTVSIISKSVSNDIEFYSENGQDKLFSLKYNPISHEFDVTRNNQTPEEIPPRDEDNSDPGADNNEQNPDSSEAIPNLASTTEQGQDQESTPQKEVVFRLNVFDTDGQEVGKLELSEEEISTGEGFNQLTNIGVYDDYYFSVWSNKHSRIKIQGEIDGNNTLGDNGQQYEDYSDGISKNDYMDNVRFKLETEGLQAVYNKAPAINLPPNRLTVYAGDEINYTSGITVTDDYDQIIPTENINVDFGQGKTEDNLVIGDNTVTLSVEDSWGRESSRERVILINNGIDKNTIKFKAGNISNSESVLEIGFNHRNKSLEVTGSEHQFGAGNNNSQYVSITIKRNNGNGSWSNSLGTINFSGNDRPGTDGEKIRQLKDYRFEYGDRIVLSHQHPFRLGIFGTVTDAREDYTDGIQNVENIINTEFEITQSGLKAVYTNPDTDRLDNTIIFGPMAPEKFPFKVKVDLRNRRLKVLDANINSILYSAGNREVYKIYRIQPDGRAEHWSFTGLQDGNHVNRVLNDKEFNYNDALYIWHTEHSRSIIKGNIKGAREDYSNGVDDIDNMNNVVFKLTPEGVESVYNNAPIIEGADTIDVYQNQEFDLTNGVKFKDDFDSGHLRNISITSQDETITRTNQNITADAEGVVTSGSVLLDTSQLGEKTITYTATDRWNKTTTITRKVIVRPRLYENVFKVFADTNQSKIIANTEQEGNTSNTDERKPVFEIGFDTLTNKYRVFNQSNDKLSETDQQGVVFEIEIKGSNGEVKKSIELSGNDRGNSPKLNELNKVNYSNGDIIRVYRSDIDAISLSGYVTGDIPSKDDMANDINKFDYMENTGFVVSNDGLKAVYNKAPELTGVIESKIVSKGDTINLLEGLKVSDDKDKGISVNDIDIYVNGSLLSDKENYKSLLSDSNIKNYTFENIGSYDIHYIISDSWGRYVLKEVKITVESKVRENSIEVYDSNQARAFKVTFNTTENKFVLTNEDTSTTYNSSSDQDKYFEMIVRNIKGEEKYKVTLNGNREHDREQLAKIHEKDFSKYDTISLYGKTHNAVKIKGSVISSNSTKTNHNYADGFGTTDKYSEVRFKITDDGLKEMIKKDPTITGIDEKTIKRGDEIDFLEGIFVNVHDQNNEDYKIDVDSSTFNKLKEGTYTITYTVTNSWGSSVKGTRNITVNPRNELEKVKLSLKNTSGNVILKIGFDSIERKLIVFDYTENATVDSGNTTTAFSINAYNSLGNTVSTLELNGNQQINQSIVDKINNFSYMEGYRLSIWSNNPQKHLDLYGDINVSNPETKKVLRNTDSVDKMENGRFEILDTGLTYIYNQAPTIQGGNTTIDYYKGSILSVPSDISVTDDHDTISKNQVVIDDDNVDYDELGVYKITYMVEDTWGRVGTKEGKINIKSSMDSNIISIYPKTSIRNGDTTNTSNSAFDIKFVRDEVAKKNKIQIEKKSNVEFDSNNPDKTFMNIVVYGANGKEKKSVKLLGRDTADKLLGKGTEDSKELTRSGESEGLNNFEYDRGDYIAIEGVTEDTKACVKIEGTVVNEREDYTDGVKTLDNIQNVRFKFTDLGLESVYNEAPVIIIDESIKLDAVKGDEIPYMRGVKLRDDHDTLSKENVKVTWNPIESKVQGDNEEDDDGVKGISIVGINKLHYEVTDSWGRTCEGFRTVELTNGILDNKIMFRQSVTKTEVLELEFIERNNGVRLQFNTKNDIKFSESTFPQPYYKFDIYSPDGVKINTFTMTGEHRPSALRSALDRLSNTIFQYGTQINFYAFHPDNLIMNGPIRGQREDYSDGVQNVENLTFVKFKITKAGLKSIYSEGDIIEANENIISIVSLESIPLKLKINPKTRKMSIYNRNNIEFYHEINPTCGNSGNIPVFGITLKGSDGQTNISVEGLACDRGNNGKFDVFNFNSNTTFNYGDTLTIWHRTPSRISIKGNVNGAREDYSDGVNNSKNLEEAVFTLTETGLKAVYKEAPKIVGLKDTKILKGQEFDNQKLNDLIEDLRATDSIDGTYEDTVILGETNQLSEVPNGTVVIDPTSVNTDEVGMYEVKYTVTNSNDRTTRKSSTVVVYDNPTITEHETNKRIELNSVANTDEAIKERLKKAVVVTDDDDKLYKKDTKLEVVSHNVKPNEQGTYTAKYKATDMYGEITEKDVTISVSRTINVSVPTTIPFQVVTNLKDEDADEFISGVMKVQNNNTSDVNVYLQSFTRQESTTTKNKNYEELQIVDPKMFTDWENISKEDSMTKMALGIYNKVGLTVDGNLQLTKQNPLWLKEDMTNVKLGVLNRANNLSTPYVSKLSFTSKHGKNFIGGTSKGKFNLVFRFE